MRNFSIVILCIVATILIFSFLPVTNAKFIRLHKKKLKLASQAASALVLLGKPKKVVFPLPVPLPIPFPIITKHDPIIHPIDPLQYLVFEKGLQLSGLGGLPGGFSTQGKRR